MQKPAFGKLAHDTYDTARTAAILNSIFLSVGSKLAEARHLAAQFVNIFHFELHTGLLCNSKQMEYRICRTAHGYVKSHGIEESLSGSNAAWQDARVALAIIFHGILHNLSGSILQQLHTVLVCGKYRSVSRQRETDSLGKRVHRIGRKHTRTASAARTRAFLNLCKFLITHTLIGSLDHCNYQIKILILPCTLFHRTTRNEHCRYIQSHGCHEHTRSNLVTVGYTHKRINLMRVAHILHTISNYVT